MHKTRIRRSGAGRGRRAAAGLAVLGLIATGCGSSSSTKATNTAAGRGTSIRLGFFPNITHAPALVGVRAGIFAKDLGADTLATSQTFTAGPAENQALLSGSIDIAFEGPSSALSAYTKSHAVTVVAGAAAGGAGLVVKKSITSVSQLEGTKLGSPQLANTQDVALRYWLETRGYPTTTTGGGKVSVQPSSGTSGTVVTEFEDGAIDGAWMPQPYEQEMVAAGGHVLVPEATLWPNGLWATTNVVVRNAFLEAHPATVSRFLHGLIDTLAFMKAHKAQAETDANAELAAVAGKALETSVLGPAWDSIAFTDDPLASTVKTQVDHGVAVGLLQSPGNLTGLYDLRPLDALLAKDGGTKVTGL